MRSRKVPGCIFYAKLIMLYFKFNFVIRCGEKINYDDANEHTVPIRHCCIVRSGQKGKTGFFADRGVLGRGDKSGKKQLGRKTNQAQRHLVNNPVWLLFPGLFQAAIAQSGSATASYSYHAETKFFPEYIKRVGHLMGCPSKRISDIVTCLKKSPATQFITSRVWVNPVNLITKIL